MLTIFKEYFVLLAGVVLLVGGLLLAGSASTAQDSGGDLLCDAETILARKAELDAALAMFEADLTADPEAALATLYNTGAAYQQLALDCGFIPADIGERFVGSDVPRIMEILADLPADPVRGQLLYNNEEPTADGNVLGCIGCHTEATVAPLTEGTWTRVDEIRLLEPQFAGYTHEHYLVESILLPWEYTVPDYPQFTMPNNFGDRLSYQDLADLLAYLLSQDQLLP